MESCLATFDEGKFKVIDITGGAPELNPDYEWLVSQAADRVAKRNGEVMTRTNLVILTHPEYAHLPKFWADNHVHVIASLPSWQERITDAQRGKGVFQKSIEGLRALNTVGYGYDDSLLALDLVMNPAGAFFPPSQASAEREFKQKLGELYDVTFNNLLTITNNPVGRFRRFLDSRGVTDEYMTKLYDAFNPATVPNMMCRSQISVGIDGTLYDCDFNQVVGLSILKSDDKPMNITDVESDGLGLVNARHIRFAGHCYACTAGAGSSCGGATA
jgi:radical SAM/Cys-rich protein